MIEKEKGPTLSKLRTIQLIEADLQLLIWIFLSLKNQEVIEIDPRISKCNYGSRQNYDIETTILEKHLIYNNSYLNGET